MTDEKQVKAYFRDGSEEHYDVGNPEVNVQNGTYELKFDNGDRVYIPVEIVREIHIYD